MGSFEAAFRRRLAPESRDRFDALFKKREVVTESISNGSSAHTIRFGATIDGIETQREISRRVFLDFVWPAAVFLRVCALDSEQRFVVGVSGAGGSGKSVICSLLAATVNALGNKDNMCAVLGMDGYHYPNSYLDTHNIPGSDPKAALRSIKGRPETFDATQLACDVASLSKGTC